MTTVAVRPVPYYTLSPGSARSVEPLVTITSGADGPELHDEEVRDDIYFLTGSSSVTYPVASSTANAPRAPVMAVTAVARVSTWG